MEELRRKKRLARARAKANIARLSHAERHEKSLAIQCRMAAREEYQNAQVIMYYHPLPGEVDTRDLIREALRADRSVLLPRMVRERDFLEAAQISDLHRDLTPGPYSVWEPARKMPVVDPARIDLVIVPGLAFSLTGARVGHGKGYYDRFLVTPGLRAFRAALVFECQLFDEVPHGEHDIGVSLIVTEARLLWASE